mgnify:CR=1 FL=1
MSRYFPALLFVTPLLGCGLDPLFEGTEELDPYGVAIKGTSYEMVLNEVLVMYPPALQQLFFRADASHLLMGVPEQGVSTFRTFAAASDNQGGQDFCATTTELALARWNGPGEFVIEGGRFFIPIGGVDVRFDSTNMDSIITEDGDWDPLTIGARVDTRDLTGVLSKGEDPCGVTEGACVSCDDGFKLCMEVDMEAAGFISDTYFDPRPDCDQP